MGAKKREKNKKKRQGRKKAVEIKTRDTSGDAHGPGLPGLNHMSSQWREFYRLVIERLKNEGTPHSV
ncbi:MAG TPA: hypothetical protein PL078_01275 [Bacillota bacterium]|nr:hypothetical protein [Peptococcaceae bacterium MAG4]NLW37561.1 hypothetical protein [Peptococcaceae bacterium]HPU35775.1 hypothetical protein [Bacillota bacterium]HPZ42610.1 hypothetical protein [Bacillota bacterium]HQD76933.1 hypothetical protein [Bacillota bacterium]